MDSRRRLLLCVCVSAGFAAAPAAEAAGPPLPSTASGQAGAVAPGGSERLITRHAGDDTLVGAVRISDGRVLRKRQIRGSWAVPPVTLNNGTTGLSADGRTLVLAQPYDENSFPPARTRLAVLDANSLRVQREIALRGFFTVDAISPDGRNVYVIQYAAENVLDYRVRALDTRNGRLAARDVIDPRKPDEQMGGLPFTRATRADGRWAYTLYGGGEETFIHALDTVGRTAACIDLDMIPSTDDLSNVQLILSPDGRRIDVRDGSTLKATVDARTFAVSEPGAAAPASRRAAATPVPPPARAADEGWPWRAVVAAGGATALLALVVLLARRRVRSARMPARRAA